MAFTKSIDLELGSSQYLSIADGSQTGLDITGDMSMEAWVKIEADATTTSQVIMSKYEATGNQKSYIFGYQRSTGGAESGLFLYISSDGSAATVKNVETSFDEGQWYHIAMTYDASAGAVDFYVNGTPLGSQQTGLPTSIYNGTAPFEVGSFGGDSYFYDGLMSQVRIFNDIRTAEEILADMGAETVSDAALDGEWSMDDVLTDASGNSNTLTNNNSAVFATDVPSGIIFDARSENDASASSPQTWSHTCGGNNRILWVGVSKPNATADDMTGITYNSVALTRLVSKSATDRGELWYLVAPATGANDIVLTFSGGTWGATAVSFMGASQDAPTISSSGNATASSMPVTVTTVDDNSFIVCGTYNHRATTFDALVTNDNTGTSGDVVFHSTAAVTPAAETTYTNTQSDSTRSLYTIAAFSPVAEAASGGAMTTNTSYWGT